MSSPGVLLEGGDFILLISIILVFSIEGTNVFKGMKESLNIFW